tara:strand:- start:77 stop:406 length:330 start_codon:yes stop_codon:yes gene_type:complete
LSRQRHEPDSAATELAGDPCEAVSPVGAKFFQAMGALGEKSHDSRGGAVRIEQEVSVAEFAFHVSSGVLAGHSQFLSTVRALEQESTGFDLLAVGVGVHHETPAVGTRR